MKKNLLPRHIVEPLEGRVVPAAFLPTDAASFVKATIGAPIELNAGQLLTTTGVPESGAYLLYVEQGNALVFTTDLNNNKIVDFNEITGIAAGDGLRLISFVDIHGDIVTNLVERQVSFPDASGNLVSETLLSLSDSDSNASNDEPHLRGDGRVVLNKTISKIEMRGLMVTDIEDQNGDSFVDEVDLDLRQPETTSSIFGDIFAGAGFGVENGGLIINGQHLQNFGFEGATRISIGSIRVGTAVSGHFFSFGATVTRQIDIDGDPLTTGDKLVVGDDINGTLLPFIPLRGQAGGSIIGVKAVFDSGAVDRGLAFSIDGLYAGDGGIGGNGGDIRDVFLNGDDSTGYEIIAGNGGRGPTGGRGGSVLNFSDTGADTGDVRIVSGDGGAGTTGGGGDGGAFSFETFNVAGNVVLDLGDGGDGFKAGGNGAGLLRGIFTQPDIALSVVTNIYGTTHLPDSSSGTYVPIIGTTRAVDFDLDGFGDMVYTTNVNSQIVVAFGTAGGGFRTVLNAEGLPDLDRINLRGPHNPHALVVADLNGDGILDIASASNDAGQQSGIVVYLGQFEDTNKNGTLEEEEDLNGDRQNSFLGFSRPIYSPLPQLQLGDPDTPNAVLPFWESPTQVTHMAAGDFNGDGQPELAVVVTYHGVKISDPVTNQTTGYDPAFDSQVVVFMEADREIDNLTGLNEYTGQFVADFGTKREEFSHPTTGQGVIVPASPLTPFIVSPAGASDTLRIHAAPVSLTSDHDVVFAGVIGGTGVAVRTLDYSQRTSGSAPFVLGTWDIGWVDTRTPVGFVRLTVQDFTVFDFDTDAAGVPEDGITDIAVIGEAVGRTFLKGFQGDNTGSGATVSGDLGNAAAGDLLSFTNGNVRIKAADLNGDGDIGELQLVYLDGADTRLRVYDFEPGVGRPHVTLQNAVIFDLNVVVEADFIDSNADLQGGILPLFADANGFEFIYGGAATPTVVRGFRLSAGDGGDSLIGRGGAGGAIGSGGRLTGVVDPISGLVVNDFVGSVQMLRTDLVRLLSGDGGDGFSTGGQGGRISGVSVRLPDPNDPDARLEVQLYAGDGGRGVNGTGGDGGSLTQNSIFEGNIFQAGNGGMGKIGGNGGSVLGNGSDVYDTNLDSASGANFAPALRSLFGFGGLWNATDPISLTQANAVSGLTTILTVSAGNGGFGTKRGGNGGDVSGMLPTFNHVVGTGFGDMAMLAGNGGNASSGPGGNGGSIRNNSPQKNASLEGDIYLQAGNGGNGSRGGHGGDVSGFSLSIQAQSAGPAILSFIGGNGGHGSTGNGGNGGNISDINASSRGIPVTAVPMFSLHTFNRVIAGEGGDSYRANGGHGGSVTNLRSSSDQGGAFAVAAGAGGDALKRGGHGGDLVNLEVNFGANTTSKGLFVAGAGGAGHALLSNPNEGNTAAQLKRLFGGTIGRGGNGGDIVGLRQTGSIGAHIDLIAGNGGDTANYGTIVDNRNFVGKAGSISAVSLSGDVGNIDPSIPIKSYNDVASGETLADFVANKLRDPSAPEGTGLSDADGNVGIIVGIAGRNKAVVLDPNGNPFVYESQPAPNSKNGTLIDLLARNVMSAVAGSVDRLASIQLTRGLRILNGELGTDKDPTGSSDYRDANGAPVTAPVRNGSLIDGALMTSTLLDATGRPISLPGRVFII